MVETNALRAVPADHQSQFIFNCVGCVMNAYNNITWESDRLEYEDGSTPYGRTYLAILGIPSKPSKKSMYSTHRLSRSRLPILRWR